MAGETGRKFDAGLSRRGGPFSDDKPDTAFFCLSSFYLSSLSYTLAVEKSWAMSNVEKSRLEESFLIDDLIF